MSGENPYAKYLEGRAAMTILAETAAAMRAALAAIAPDKALLPPAPGKWSAREIVAHMADCELVFGFRMRQAVAEERPAILLFDQDKWASLYGGFPVAASLEAFEALRAWNLAFLRAAPEGSGERILVHPKRGEMSLAQMLEMIAGHDGNHLEQLRRIAV